MAEWLNAPVLKTGGPKGLGGSNPSPSASLRSKLEEVGMVKHLVVLHGVQFLGLMR